jgi:hypothetical protein
MTFKHGVLDWAVQMPLGPEDEPTIKPEVLIFHTIVGGLKAADSLFRAGGYDGTEATFGVGGTWDGPELDGVVWQWQNANKQADAQFAGNAYADSAETSDGGNPHHPWSSLQLRSLIHLGVDFCDAHEDRKPHLVNTTGPIGSGAFGYHELRHDWNTDGHVCPGPVREGQLRTIVIPKIRALLAGKPVPHAPKPHPVPAHHTEGKLAVDGILGHGTIGAIQHVLLAHHLNVGTRQAKATVDGLFGPVTRMSLQAYLARLGFYHSQVDGAFGPLSTKALQAYLVHHGELAKKDADGHWRRTTTRALQKALNDGRF